MKRLVLTLVVMSILLIGGMAHAAPVQWSGNNHWYEAIYSPDGITWDDA